MTIKIDLLPAYVGMRRRLKLFIMFCVSLVLVVGAILSVLYYQGEQQLAKLKTDYENVKRVADQTVAEQGKTSAANAKAGPYKATVDFIVAAGQTGPERAALIDLIRQWIYRGALVSSIDISDGNIVKMQAALRQPSDYAQFLGILRRAGPNDKDPAKSGPLFKDKAMASGIPGYGGTGAAPGVAQPTSATGGPPGTAPGAAPATPALSFPLSVTAQATLKNPVTIPPETTGGAGAAPAGGPPGGGPPGGGPPGGGPPGGGPPGGAR